MAIENKFAVLELAAAGSTSNNTHSGVELKAAPEPGGRVGIAFTVSAAGLSPTVTYKVQGSFDGTTFADVILLPSDNETAAVSKTVTAVGTTISHVAQAHTRAYRYLRLVTSANTNITYGAKAYVERV